MKHKNKILLVLESPAKAKTVSKYLGSEYIVRASYGHVCDLAKINHLGVDVKNNFAIQYSVLPEKKDKILAILDAASMAKEIILATDPDREGEAIAENLRSLLEKTRLPIRRARFYEITKNGILNGLNSLSEVNQSLVQAQQARRVLDRLVGYLVSPLLIDAFGSGNSAGRVQSVALRMIIDREQEIKEFQPKEYWPITINVAKSLSDNSFMAHWSGSQISNQEEAQHLKHTLESLSYRIDKVKSLEKVKNPPAPLETATLQQKASQLYQMSSKKTMEVAQSLYEGGLITYHRVDSVHSSPVAIEAARAWLTENGFEIPSKPIQHSTKDAHIQGAHEAIRPTDIALIPDQTMLAPDEKDLYSLIWQTFIASQMTPAIFDATTICIISSQQHTFEAQGKVLKKPGWMALSGSLPKDEQLPILTLGDSLVLVPPGVQTTQKFTQPPPRYKDHSLVEQLKKTGIGRPSTYSAILSKISERGYVVKEKGTYVGTELGQKISEFLTKFFDFMQYRYTAAMEDQLDKISTGELSYLEMLQSFFSGFAQQLKKANLYNEPNLGLFCPHCNSPFRLRHGKFGFYLLCSGYPECRTSQSCEIIDGRPSIKKQNLFECVPGLTCPKCQSGMTLRDGKFGKYYSCVQYPKCTGSRKLPSGYKCDKCGYDMFITLFDGVSKLACMGYPACRNIKALPEQPKDWINPAVLPARQNKVSKLLKKVS